MAKPYKVLIVVVIVIIKKRGREHSEHYEYLQMWKGEVATGVSGWWVLAPWMKGTPWRGDIKSRRDSMGGKSASGQGLRQWQTWGK
jgi:hypothetical protein